MSEMFSSRLHWDLNPNRIAQAIERQRTAGAPVLDLTESNPTHAGLEYPAEILASFASPKTLLYDPAPAGSPEARALVSSYYADRGRAVAPERVLITASTSESYGYLFKLLADPGDDVLVPRPSYPLFEFLASMESVRVGQYALRYHGRWELDMDSLERAVTPRTRAVVVVNPNNPTGSFLKRSELAVLGAFCARRRIAIISDEVFSDYPLTEDGERMTSLVDEREALTFSMSGLSKIAGLPQMKLGWIVAGGPGEFRREALARLELIADTYLSVATPVQVAFPSLLEAGARVRQQIASRTAANLRTLDAALARQEVCARLRVEGGWYATVRVPRTRTEEEWTIELLERDGVLVQPGFFYDFETEAYLVLSLLTPGEIFAEGVRRLLARTAH